MDHQTSDLTPAELDAEIDEVLALGATGPKFCGTPYVGLTNCVRKGDHDDRHAVVGLTGRIISW